MTMPILVAVTLSVLAVAGTPTPPGAHSVVMLPFQNISGTEGAPETVAAELTRRLEAKGYRVVRGEAVDEFLAAEKIRYLDSLPASRREKLLRHFEASAVVVGDVFDFTAGMNPVVALSARMLGADGRAVWAAIAGLSSEDTVKVFGVGKLATLDALAAKTVDLLARDLPAPGAVSPLESARAKPVDLPAPRTFRSAALAAGENLVCLLPLENQSSSRVAPRIVGELLAQRLSASKTFRAVEAADFREAMRATGVYGTRTGDPQELTKLGARVGTTLFLKGTVLRYKDVLPGSFVQTPEIEIQLELVDVAKGRVLWTSSLARKGTDYSGLLLLGGISNAATLSDQAIAEMISGLEHTEGKGHRPLTVTLVAADKTYDGNNSAAITSCKVSGATTADAANLRCTATSASFSDQNAGLRKSVTAVGLTLSGSAAKHYVLDSDTVTTTATIRPKPVIATVAATDKTYDGTPSATIKSCTVSGMLAADSNDVTCSADNASFSDSNAGSEKIVTAGGIGLAGAASRNYVPSSPTATTTATIRRKPVTAEVTISGRTYDATAAATVAACVFPGVFPADAANVACHVGEAAFDDANAGIGKRVAVTGIILSGTASRNYALRDATASATADIAPKTVVAAIAVADKVYDGTPAATVTDCRLAGVIESDSDRVGCEASAGAFADKNAAAGKPVTASLVLGGAAAGNYVLRSPSATTVATITPRTLSPSGAIVRDRVYDGTTQARLDISGAELIERVVDDDVVLDERGVTANFADKDVGTGKLVMVSGLALEGRDARNYVLDQPTWHARITPRSVEPRIQAANKVYDGSTAATLSGEAVLGVLPADANDVRLTSSGSSFDTKNVGSDKTVTATGLSLFGDESRNYALPASSARTRADITPKHITGSFTVADKRYDGGTSAIVQTRSLNGALPGDAVRLSGGRARFADATVRTGKTVTLEGSKLIGADAANYVLDNVAPTTADITPLRREHQ